jgi:hypothetical protein
MKMNAVLLCIALSLSSAASAQLMLPQDNMIPRQDEFGRVLSMPTPQGPMRFWWGPDLSRKLPLAWSLNDSAWQIFSQQDEDQLLKWLLPPKTDPESHTDSGGDGSGDATTLYPSIYTRSWVEYRDTMESLRMQLACTNNCNNTYTALTLICGAVGGTTGAAYGSACLAGAYAWRGACLSQC